MGSASKADGVDIPVGDAFSAFAWQCCQRTFQNSPHVVVSNLAKAFFRGPRGYRLKGLLNGYYQTTVSDGVGTKVEVSTAARTHRKVGADLVAMAAMDIVRYGGLPLVFVNVLDVKTLGEMNSETYQLLCEVMEGIADAATTAGLVLLGGETAELGQCVGSTNPNSVTAFNVAGFCQGVYHSRFMINGNKLKQGDVVLALREYGFRSNGISSVRKALTIKYGPEWWSNPEAASAVQAAATPSASYEQLLTNANGWNTLRGGAAVTRIPISAIAHISGGGIVGKFGADILKNHGLSAELPNLWDPPQIMRDCAVWRGLTDRELYNSWNGGQGALVCMDREHVSAFMALAEVFGVEAKECGVVTKQRVPKLVIGSKFSGSTLEYDLADAA